MYKTPPRDENQHDESEHAQKLNSSQKRSRALSKRRHKAFYSDEHPEIPRIKRASLYLDNASLPPASTEQTAASDDTTEVPSSVPTRPARSSTPPSSRARLARPSRSASSKVRLSRPTKIPMSPSSAPTRRESSHEPPSSPSRSARLRPPAEEYDERETSPAPPTSKIMVAPRRRSPLYQPPPSVRSRSRKAGSHPSRPASSRRRQSRRPVRKRTPLLIIAAILAPLLVLSFIITGTFNNLRHAAYTITLPGTQITPDNVSSSRGSPVADSHKLVITPANTDHPAPPVFASSAYLLDADTGATLYAHNPFMHLPMLSTTKLMTALLAAEQGNPDQQITINDAITHDINDLSADSSLMGIKKGETYTLRDLLYGLMLASGNDAAVAIGDSLSGNLQNFVAQMNRRADQLGLHDTHYMNPHGLLANNHFSSAHDLAFLGKYALSIPLIRQISGVKEYHIPTTPTHKEHYLVNGNQFLWWYPGVDGGKPGWDGGKNFVQVISCMHNHHHLIGVAMHTVDWWTDMRDLMNWGFDTFKWISPAEIDLTSPIPFDYDWNYFVRDKKENTIPTDDHGRYYIYTGYSVSGPILTYFDKRGGLKKFGYPTALPKTLTTTTLSQQFEHATIQCELNTKQCNIA